MDASKLPLVAVVGLTASGKSGFSLQLAAALGERGVACEIISADAFQLYRGMDIGTAKVSVQERGGIPHHLLDVLELEEKASVAAYQRSCRQVINEIRAREALPILVGGSGLYVRAVLDKIEFPGTDSGIRAQLETQAAQLGIKKMHQRLAEVDPESAARIVPANERRVIRALEVYELTGKKFSATMPRREYFQPAVQLGIKWPLAVLDERISQRTAQMLTQGFIEEVAELEKRGLADTPTACRATGYQAVMDYLAGKITREESAE
ncbi:tRNA (adenosine(37)-N6)-dimethylallyltransferase MiaA, partial [Varibaculum cambriense]